MISSRSRTYIMNRIVPTVLERTNKSLGRKVAWQVSIALLFTIACSLPCRTATNTNNTNAISIGKGGSTNASADTQSPRTAASQAPSPAKSVLKAFALAPDELLSLLMPMAALLLAVTCTSVVAWRVVVAQREMALRTADLGETLLEAIAKIQHQSLENHKRLLAEIKDLGLKSAPSQHHQVASYLEGGPPSELATPEPGDAEARIHELLMWIRDTCPPKDTITLRANQVPLAWFQSHLDHWLKVIQDYNSRFKRRKQQDGSACPDLIVVRQARAPLQDLGEKHASKWEITVNRELMIKIMDRTPS